MKTDTEYYTLPVERGLRFLLFDVMKTILIILSIVVINFLLLGLYILFSKFNFISYLVFLGLIGVGTYFIINHFNYVSKHSKRAIPNSDKSLFEGEEPAHDQSTENVQKLSELTLRKLKHMQNIIKKEGLSNMTIKDEDLVTFENIPAYIRERIVLDSQLGEEKAKISKFTISGKMVEDNTGKEFEERVKVIMFELFEELTKELRSLESHKVHSLKPKIIKEIKETADRDVKKLKELLTILYEILGDDFFTDNYADNNYKKLLDKDYLKTIKGKFKSNVLQNPNH